MTRAAPIRCLLLDIEGTIAPIAFVHEVLFPYARRELPAYLATHRQRPDVQAACSQVAHDAGAATLADRELLAHLLALMDRDAKSTGLKQLQGLIWADGYRNGRIQAELFADVAPALRRFHAAGISLRIYSSGSIQAQRDLLAHTTDGDLSPLIAGFYDTTSGPKREAASYARILASAGFAPGEMLFVSDLEAELDAAQAAGLPVRLCVRPGNAPVVLPRHATVRTLDELGIA